MSHSFGPLVLDPLANLNLLEADFGWATHKIMDVADLRSAGRVISEMSRSLLNYVGPTFPE